MNSNSAPRNFALPIRLAAVSLDLFALEISHDVLALLPPYIVRAERTVPVELDGDVLVVALENPGDFQLRERIQFIANRELRVAVATRAAVDHLIEAYYATVEETDDQ